MVGLTDDSQVAVMVVPKAVRSVGRMADWSVAWMDALWVVWLVGEKVVVLEICLDVMKVVRTAAVKVDP